MIESIGIVRRMDDLGRIVIPKELRKAFNLNPGDAVAITNDGRKLTLVKYVSDNLQEEAEKVARVAEERMNLKLSFYDHQGNIIYGKGAKRIVPILDDETSNVIIMKDNEENFIGNVVCDDGKAFDNNVKSALEMSIALMAQNLKNF